MNKLKNYNYLSDFVNELQSDGRYSFALDELKNRFSLTNEAIKLSLRRLSGKGKVVSVRKGFYVIVPPEYARQKVLPPSLFIDQLMNHIEKPYYVGLLSAAAMLGAAHQQPQEYQIVTEVPPLRDISKHNMRVVYFNKRNMPKVGIEERKTDTGYIKISSPELTGIDLIQFAGKIGGLSRVVTVMYELVEQFNEDRLVNLLTVVEIKISYWQRLGFILEKYLADKMFSDLIFLTIKEKKYYRIALNPEGEIINLPANNRWRVVENIQIESDL